MCWDKVLKSWPDSIGLGGMQSTDMCDQICTCFVASSYAKESNCGCLVSGMFSQSFFLLWWLVDILVDVDQFNGYKVQRYPRVSRLQWVKEWRLKWLRTRRYQALSWPTSMELASQKDKGNELVLSMLTSQLKYFYLWVLVVNQNLGSSSLSVILWVLYLQEAQPDSKNKIEY
jgi:hypothetical protein